MTKALRFAPIIRVSTEKQERQGESLRTQTEQIKNYVQSLGGTIPEYCWKYSGQEHATPGQERTRLAQLLKDSDKGLFDAVIVCDASRWSRDNLKSKEGLNILRDNQIKFFVATMEYDLYNPAQNLFLGMSAEIGEYQAREQSLKSITNRINRAKQGIPTSGKLPYGRTWDKLKGWGIDAEKQKLVQTAATRYLGGENIIDIARSYNINASNLHKILTKRSGTEWKCQFINKDVNVDETVVMKIPFLLDENTIEAIQERARNNITYVRGHHKYKYLLAGNVFCMRCGYSMASYRNHSGKQYYRHSKNGGGKCDLKKLVPATELENSVLIQLMQTLGDVEKIKESIQRAIPDLSKLDAINKEQIQLSKKQKNIEAQKSRLVDLAANGILSKDEIKQKVQALRDSEESIQNRLQALNLEVSNVPDMKSIKSASQWAGKVIASITRSNPKLIFKRSYEWKRRLIEYAFAGISPDGKRLGVYVDYQNGQFIFNIHGLLVNTVNTLPLSDDYLTDTFHIDPEFQDLTKELNTIKSNIHSECDAYYCERFY